MTPTPAQADDGPVPRDASRATSIARRLLVATAWVVVAIGVALGGAGIVAGGDHLPSTGARPELTWGGDRSVAQALDHATESLAAIESATARLGATGRSALSHLVAADATAVVSLVADGERILDEIDSGVSGLRADLAALPLGAPDAEVGYSAATRERYARLSAALTATDALRADWATLAAGSLPALELVDHLLAHDREAGAAALAGSAGKYAAALRRLGAAEAQLAAARTIRDALAQSIDVATLDEWIARNAAIDAALRELYTLLEASHGRATPAVSAAFTKVKAAQAALPPDTRALVVILADIARGGLNQAVISIEEARGRLAAAGGTVQ